MPRGKEVFPVLPSAHQDRHRPAGADPLPVNVCTTVNVFLDAGVYYGVDWARSVLVDSGATLSPVITNSLTYLATLGGGSIFLNLIGTHVFSPTVDITVAGVSFFGLGKSTILQIDAGNPQVIFTVNADDVTFQNFAIDGNKAAYVTPGNLRGIRVEGTSVRTLILGCYFYSFPDVNDHGISCAFGSDVANVVVADCHFKDNESYSIAFASAGGHCIAHGCTVVDSGGFEASQGSFNIFADNTFKGVSGSMSPLILAYTLNLSIGNTFESTRNILLQADDCACIGCVFSGCVDQAITAKTGSDILIVGNTITASTARQAGITLSSSGTRTAIFNNRINCVYGVYVYDDTIVTPIIKDNNFNGCTTPVYFRAGTIEIICDNIVVPFVDGTAPQDSGFLIDGAGDMARAFAFMPNGVHQVLGIKVYARAAALTGADTHMRAEFVIYGAADNEGYQTHNGSIANHPSISVNFAVDDVIYWTIRTVGVLALLGEDSVEVKVLHEDADGEVATNAYFRTVAIEYV